MTRKDSKASTPFPPNQRIINHDWKGLGIINTAPLLRCLTFLLILSYLVKSAANFNKDSTQSEGSIALLSGCYIFFFTASFIGNCVEIFDNFKLFQSADSVLKQTGTFVKNSLKELQQIEKDPSILAEEQKKLAAWEEPEISSEQSIEYSRYPNDQPIRLTFNIQEQQIYKHWQQTLQLCKRLAKKNPDNVIKIPDDFKNWPGYFYQGPASPVWAARLLDFTFIPSFLAMYSLTTSLWGDENISHPLAIFLITLYPLIQTGATIIESSLLKDINVQLKANGFSFLYRDIWQWPPTCLGQYYTRKLIYKGMNTFLKKMLDFIYDAEQSFQQILSDPSIEIPNALRGELENLTFLLAKKEVAESLPLQIILANNAFS